MKVGLFDFQEDALAELHTKLTAARLLASVDNPQAVSFSAPTGAGKTIMNRKAGKAFLDIRENRNHEKQKAHGGAFCFLLRLPVCPS